VMSALGIAGVAVTRILLPRRVAVSAA
jgi:hypothetical protein